MEPPGADNNTEWETIVIAREKYPDDWRKWPEDKQRLVQAAVDRLLERTPDVRVLSDTSFCAAPGHPRYPEPDPKRPWNNNAFWLVRQIKLDRPISQEE